MNTNSPKTDGFIIALPTGSITCDHRDTMEKIEAQMSAFGVPHIHPRNIRRITRKTLEHASDAILVQYARIHAGMLDELISARRRAGA